MIFLFLFCWVEGMILTARFKRYFYPPSNGLILQVLSAGWLAIFLILLPMSFIEPNHMIGGDGFLIIFLPISLVYPWLVLSQLLKVHGYFGYYRNTPYYSKTFNDKLILGIFEMVVLSAIEVYMLHYVTGEWLSGGT